MMSTTEVKSADYNGVPPAIIPPECAGLRLDVALARVFPEHSRCRLQSWLKAGQIQLDGSVASPKHKVHGGECIRCAVAPAPSLLNAPENIAFPIIYEDAAILVIDKPAGLVVHPGNGHAAGTLMNALLHHAPNSAEVPRAGIVHRLDKDTTGLMVVAKTLAAQTDLVRQLQARSVKRHYFALVHGNLCASGTVDAPLGRHPVQRTKMAIITLGGKSARTHYQPVEEFSACTLVQCQLDTGRTHQIRVHMASLKHPLVGDPVYGKTRSGTPVLDAFPRQALHAFRLALRHPESQQAMEWQAPLPSDFAALIEHVRTS